MVIVVIAILTYLTIGFVHACFAFLRTSNVIGNEQMNKLTNKEAFGILAGITLLWPKIYVVEFRLHYDSKYMEDVTQNVYEFTDQMREILDKRS